MWMKIIHSMVEIHPQNDYICCMIQRRNITPFIIDALADTPVVLVNGARQTGKSTLVQKLAAHDFPAHYLSFDDIEILNAARSDPAGFIAGLPNSVILDEVQRVPEIFISIKASVDRLRKPGRFLLTGSANVMLLPRLSESLAGRMEILTLFPLSQGEIEGINETFIDKLFSNKTFNSDHIVKIQIADIANRIVQGGYPEVLTRQSESRRKAWFKSYLLTTLHRDVRELANIEGLNELPRLVNLLGARVTSLMNYAELSRTTTFPQTTLKRYMTLLEALFLVQPLPAWSSNLSKRLVKSPKLMLNDTGLVATLIGVNATKLEHEHHILGILLENFVVNELRKQASWSETQPQLFHFRSQSGHEVDIILENAEQQLVAIEVKAKTTLTDNDFKGLKLFGEMVGKKLHRGILLYLGNKIIPLAKNIHAIPLNLLWT